MKTFSYIFAIAALLCINVAVVQAQDAKTILDNVRAKYESMESFSSNFVFEIDIPEADVELMRGKLFLKGEKYMLEMSDQEIISDNVNLYHWLKEYDEVQINYVDGDEEILSPSQIFSMYLKGFSYKLITTSKHEGRKVGLIEIAPGDREKEYFKVKTVVNLDTNDLEQMQIFYKDGTVYTFSVSNLKEEKLSDSMFTLDLSIFSENQIIDMR